MAKAGNPIEWVGGLDQAQRVDVWTRATGEVPAMLPSAADLLILLEALDNPSPNRAECRSIGSGRGVGQEKLSEVRYAENLLRFTSRRRLGG